ncbi:helix-turn-helix transcriptional regulator [Herbiconiux liukaitaii]|uniref:helix-turn-helix transcriptional regulator n=1 Tax=Herbiconiux liukaitaii TaxID=3342799 RepID=UPI0035B8B5C2
MGRHRIALTPPARDAAEILGQQVRFARHERQWTAAELAARADVSLETLAAIEAGKPTVAIGNVFNVAAAAGVPLFGAETDAELSRLRRAGADRLALLPTRVRPKAPALTDADRDF